jgi:replicative DNA helicase
MGDALEKLSKASIFIDDSSGGSLMEIKSKARRLKMESGLDLLIVDYLQLM